MCKLYLFLVVLGGFIFSNSYCQNEKESLIVNKKNNYAWAENFDKEDHKLERRSRKSHRGRRRGGSGLR